MLVDLDGTLVSGSSGEAVDQLSSGGDTGWKSIQIPLGLLPAGTHDLTIGAYNNRKTAKDQMSELYIDNVQVSPAGAGF